MIGESPAFPRVKYDSSTPVVDREQIGMLLMSDDPEEVAMLAGQLFDLFVDEAEQKLADLDSVCAAGDVAAFRKIVHFVAGSAGNLECCGSRHFYAGSSRRSMKRRFQILLPVQ